MPAWLRRGFYALGALLVLLLLSALVEGPSADPAEQAPPSLAAGFVLIPKALPAEPEPLGSEHPPEVEPGSLYVLHSQASRLAHAPAGCDANGCVVRTQRYVRSAYQVFRQEAACG